MHVTEKYPCVVHSSLRIDFLCFLNADPYNGLVKKSAISSVASWSISTMLFFTWSAIQNAWILKRLVLLPLLFMPFLSSSIALMLSYNSVILDSSIFWACMKYFVQIAYVRISSAATNSVSVELLVFIFCRVEDTYTAPLPKVIRPTVCPFMSEWTTWDLSAR